MYTRIMLLAVLSTGIVSAQQPQYLQPYFPYYSQAGQDKFLNTTIFCGKRNGVFIDVGAHDGISYSNSYYFEKELGWTGICIEPHTDNFNLLTRNRSCACYCTCAGNKNGSVFFLKVNGPAEMLSGIFDDYDPKHIARIEAEIATNGGSFELTEVPMKTISSMLEEQHIYEVDFISIDVEGGEFTVLDGIDFDRFTIHYILIENNRYPGFFEKLKTYLAARNYRHLCHVGYDELFVKNN